MAITAGVGMNIGGTTTGDVMATGGNSDGGVEEHSQLVDQFNTFNRDLTKIQSSTVIFEIAHKKIEQTCVKSNYFTS